MVLQFIRWWKWKKLLRNLKQILYWSYLICKIALLTSSISPSKPCVCNLWNTTNTIKMTVFTWKKYNSMFSSVWLHTTVLYLLSATHLKQKFTRQLNITAPFILFYKSLFYLLVWKQIKKAQLKLSHPPENHDLNNFGFILLRTWPYDN